MTLRNRGIGSGHLQPVTPAIRDDLPALPVQTREGEQLDVFVQDQTAPAFDLFFAQLVTETTLAADSTINTYTIELTPGHGILVGDYLAISNNAARRSYFGTVLVVAVNDITLDTPLNFDFPAGSDVREINRELNVNGSSTRETFFVTSPFTGIDIDITRIMIQITDDSAMDDGTFGGITALTRGVVLRKVDDVVRNFWNVKTNGDFANLSFDATYSDRAPAGQFGFRVRYTFAGQDKHGVAVRLIGGPLINETLELIVQDDLTDLLSFRIIAAGHIVLPLP